MTCELGNRVGNPAVASSLVSVSAVTAGIVPPLIGLGGTVALVIRAEQTMGATSLEAGSGVAAMCIAIGLTGMVLSWRWRMPLVLAWSTPGAALLASNTAHISHPIALGAFAIASALMMFVALMSPLTALAERIPPEIASGMLAGILLPFGLKLFSTIPADPLFAVATLVSFLGLRAWMPRYALSGALVIGILIILFRIGGSMPHSSGITARLLAERPQLDIGAMVSIAVPLFLVTLVSQNIPGLVVMQAAGYNPSPRWSFFASGAATLVTAPFGGFGINLAAIVAALCTGPDAHQDSEKRWIVGVIYGSAWLVMGLLSGIMVSFLTGLPSTIITIITGVALLGPLVGALQAMSAATADLDAGVVTLVTAASGVTLFSIGSAFWALVAGFGVTGARRFVAHLRAVGLSNAQSQLDLR